MMRDLRALGAGTWTVAVCVLALVVALLIPGCALSSELREAQDELARSEARLEEMKAAPGTFTLEEWSAAVASWQQAQAALVEAGQAEAGRTLTGLPSTIEAVLAAALSAAGVWVGRDATRKRQLAHFAPAHPEL